MERYMTAMEASTKVCIVTVALVHIPFISGQCGPEAKTILSEAQSEKPS